MVWMVRRSLQRRFARVRERVVSMRGAKASWYIKEQRSRTWIGRKKDS